MFSIPTSCPYCGATLAWTTSGANIICDNSACPELRKLAVYKYLESICKDIKGLGDAFLEAFVAELGATSIVSLLRAAELWRGKEFKSLGRADNIIAQKVISAIDVEEINPERFLVGLGVPLLGATFAKELAKNPEGLKRIFTAIENWEFRFDANDRKHDLAVTDVILSVLPGREALANNILRAAEEIQDILFYINENAGLFDYEFEGVGKETRYYAITGSLSKSRKEIEAEFAKKNWQLTDSISKAECLVNNDNLSSSSKNLKAKKAGKPILTEAEFRSSLL